MIPDWADVALRFLHYGTLLPFFGLIAYPAYSRTPGGAMPGWTVGALAAVCLMVSAAAFALTLKAMTGSPVFEVDPELARFVILDTPTGTAFLVRTALLGATIIVATMPRCRRFALPLVGGAVATLAWSGHAAATEGIAGTVHRIVDAAHLLAAGAWLGALVLLLAASMPGPTAQPGPDRLLAALRRFSGAGTILVATIVLSGAYNMAATIGSADPRQLAATGYGRLLALKLLAFVGMLMLAAANRWRLTPRLASNRDGAAKRALRRSIAVELVAGIAILAIVALLGTLDPSAG